MRVASDVLLVVLTACLLGSLWAAALGWLPRSGAGLILLGLVASLAAVALLRGRPLAWLLATFVGAACWGALLAPAPTLGADPPPSGGLARIQLEVGRGGCGEQGCWCEGRLLTCTELEPGSCVAPGTLLGVSSAGELPIGARVTALARLRLRQVFRNPSSTAAWPDLRPPIYAGLEPAAAPRVDALSPLDAWVAGVRTRARRALDHSLKPPHAGIARALLLGEGAAVEPALNDAIRGAGVSHVLAVSGMHVTLLVGALVAALRWCWLRTPLALRWEARRAAATLGALLAPLLARLCGAAPSAMRAGWTSALVFALVALGRRPSVLSASALVVAAYAALSPRDALHPGFVLSVLATAALLTASVAAPGTGAVRRAFQESLRAWLATAPFLLLCFGQTSLVALAANVLLLPLGSALVPVAAVHLAATPLAAVLPTGSLFELASGAFVAAARFCSGLHAGVSLPPLTALQVLSVTALTACFMLPLRPRARALGCVVAAACCGWAEWSLRSELAPGALRVTFLDVGQGDATLIETGDGRAALIDAGGSLGAGPDPGARAVLPLLRARRIAVLDLVVLSHPHPDHYGGLHAVLAALPVRELWDTGQAEAEAAADHAGGGPVAALLALARARGTRVRRPAELCAAPQALGRVRLEVLAPCPAFDEALGANDNSFVIRLVHGARSVLFTGDAEAAGEAALVVSGRRLRSDVLKVAHHGSRTSSTPALLRAVAPNMAVVSAGRGNRFGHPHPDVLARLDAVVPRLLRTDHEGGIELRCDGHRLSVRTARTPP